MNTSLHTFHFIHFYTNVMRAREEEETESIMALCFRSFFRFDYVCLRCGEEEKNDIHFNAL